MLQQCRELVLARTHTLECSQYMPFICGGSASHLVVLLSKVRHFSHLLDRYIPVIIGVLTHYIDICIGVLQRKKMREEEWMVSNRLRKKRKEERRGKKRWRRKKKEAVEEKRKEEEEEKRWEHTWEEEGTMAVAVAK